MEDALTGAKLNKDKINSVILVGGSCRIPKVRALLAAYFGAEKILDKAVNPDEAIAYGATLKAAQLAFGRSDIHLTLLDVTAFSLGINTTEGMSKIINKNSPVPIRSTKNYTNVEDNQTSVFIKAYQGENKAVDKNHLLSTFNLEIPPLPKEQAKIQVTFEIDSSGLLKVTAVSLDSGKSKSINIKVSNDRLAHEEISKLTNLQKELSQKPKKPKKTTNTSNAFGLD